MHDDSISLEEYVKYNLKWIACDNRDHIAIFESAGYAPMPDSIWASRSGRIEVVDYFKQAKVIGNSIRHPEMLANMHSRGNNNNYMKNCDYWGFRGIFVYNVVDDPMRLAPFERAVSPEIPLKLVDLPEPIKAIVERSRLRISFPTAQQISFQIVGTPR